MSCLNGFVLRLVSDFCLAIVLDQASKQTIIRGGYEIVASTFVYLQSTYLLVRSTEYNNTITVMRTHFPTANHKQSTAVVVTGVDIGVQY